MSIASSQAPIRVTRRQVPVLSALENGVAGAVTDLVSKVQGPENWASFQAAVGAGLGIGKSVWVGYPRRLSGIVHGISDAKRTLERTEVEGGGFAASERATAKTTLAAEALRAAASSMEHRATAVEAPVALPRVCVAAAKDILTGVPVKFASVPGVFPSCAVVAMT